MTWFRNGLTERERDHYERQIALLQEQLSSARDEAQRHCERADRAVDEVVKLVGLRSISSLGQQEAAQRAEKTAAIAEQAVQRADLMFNEVPIGDPRGRYKTLEETSLDIDEVEAPLPPLSHFLKAAH